VADIPVPTMTVRRAAERLETALAEVRRLTNRLGNELTHLEIYAREQAGGADMTVGEIGAYRDMADRIRTIRGEN
jgi:hypothetical protein